MSAPLSRRQIAWRAAQDIPDGSFVNLGVGLPTLVSDYVPTGREVIYQSENGILGMGPAPEPGNEDPDLIRFMHSDNYAEMREANERLIAKSLVRLRENLGSFLLNIPKRIPRLWISSYHPGLPDWVLLFIRMAGVSVLLLGLYGIWGRRSEIGSFVPVLLFPAYITAMGAPLNTTARYTIPVRDLYLIFCAAALTYGYERIRSRRAGEAP